MNVLAIDTSTRACVLGIQTEAKLYVDEAILGRSHSQEILPRLINLFEKSSIDKEQLDLIVFGQGPGSFTGLRIGVGVVQGLAYGLNIPVVGVSSLACLAQKIYRREGASRALVALTARHEEVYFGSYQVEQGISRLQGIEAVIEADEIPNQSPADEAWVGIGSGWQLGDKLATAAGVVISDVYLDELPSAVDLISLGLDEFAAGHGTDAMLALPEYLREQVASVPKLS